MNAPITNPLLRFVVYSHLWLAMGAAAQVMWIQAILHEGGWQAPVLAFCGTIVFYTFMRLARMEHPELGTAPHLVWFREHKRTMIGCAAVCAMAGAVIGHPFARDLIHMLWPAGLIGLLYVVPMGLAGGRTMGLRRVPVMKSFFIAFAWALITTGLPLAMNGRELFNEDGTWFFVLQFTFVLALAIAFDIRDLPNDPRSLRTLPQLLGANIAKAFAVLFVLPYVLFLLIAIVISYEPIEPGWRSAQVDLRLLFPMFGYLFTTGLVARAGPRRSEAYYTFVIDGMLVVIPVLGWIGALIR